MGYKDKDKQREYQRTWCNQRRTEFFKDKECYFCKSKKNLQLHHIDKDDKIASAIWSWEETRRLEEIAKCIILCESCHISLHAAERTKPLVHGTSNAYKRKGCKCSICRKWNARDKRRQRKARELKLINAL